MNAAVVTAFDAPPRYTTFADPVAQEGEAVVNVTAAGLHPIVKALASGSHYGSQGTLPFIPGVDGVGKLNDGTRVYFGISRSPFGTFSECALARRGMYLPLPDSLDDVTAAGLANPGMSSAVALIERAKFVAGNNVFILGATGIAGQLAVQIAKRFGAQRVVAAGRNPKSLERLYELGADLVLSLDEEHEALVSALRREWSEHGVNIVLDYLWGQPAEAVLESLSQKGLSHAASQIRFVQIGESAGKAIGLPAATLRNSAIEPLRSGFGSASMQQIFQILARFFESAAAAPFRINFKAVPLRDVESLWNSPEQGVRLVFQP